MYEVSAGVKRGATQQEAVDHVRSSLGERQAEFVVLEEPGEPGAEQLYVYRVVVRLVDGRGALNMTQRRQLSKWFRGSEEYLEMNFIAIPWGSCVDQVFHAWCHYEKCRDRGRVVAGQPDAVFKQLEAEAEKSVDTDCECGHCGYCQWSQYRRNGPDGMKDWVWEWARFVDWKDTEEERRIRDENAEKVDEMDQH